jgi:hypothetical protein
MRQVTTQEVIDSLEPLSPRLETCWREHWPQIEEWERSTCETARQFAIVAHGAQRYGDRPYIVHLDAVHRLACEQKLSADVKVAAFLHDMLEDTSVKPHEISRRYGDRVGALVLAVTNCTDRTPGYKERTYRKILEAGANAVALKLCDRVCNLRACEPGKHDRLIGKYLRGSPLFERYLRRALGSPCIEELWWLYSEQLARLEPHRFDFERRVEETRKALHPFGECTCVGEGRCAHCKKWSEGP